MAKDFLGREVKVGDDVVFMQKNYRTFTHGTIVSIAEKTVLLSHKATNWGSTQTRQFHDQVILFTKP